LLVGRADRDAALLRHSGGGRFSTGPIFEIVQSISPVACTIKDQAIDECVGEVHVALSRRDQLLFLLGGLTAGRAERLPWFVRVSVSP